MNLQIKKLNLSNYKGLRDAEYEFYPVTHIQGKNAQGKTTLMDAYFDLMTGKMADGSAPDNVRPHDDKGEVINNVSIERGLDLMVDGNPISVRKVTNQKWRLPRGGTEAIFDGNVTTYVIDGFDKKQKEFDDWKEKAIADPETLLMCSNPSYFLNKLSKSTAEGRKILERLSGFDIKVFLSKHKEYFATFSKMKGNSSEDVLKQLRKNLREEVKRVDAIQANITYEKKKRLEPATDVSDLIAEREGWGETIFMLNERMASLKKIADDINSIQIDIAMLNAKKSAMETEIIKKNSEAKSQLNEFIHRYEVAIVHAQSSIDFQLKSCPGWEEDLGVCKSRRQSLLQEYAEVKSAVITRENSKCKFCGQTLTKTKFDAVAKDYAIRKKERLDAISSEGKEKAKRITELDKLIKNSKAVIEEKTREIQGLNEKITATKAQLASLVELDINDDVEYRAIVEQINMLKAKVALFENPEEELKSVTDDIEKANQEMRRLQLEITKVTAIDDSEKAHISRLNEELGRQAQICADLEREIADVIDFHSPRIKPSPTL